MVYIAIQELVLLGGNDTCGVLPGEVVEYECAVANLTATTVFKITWPNSPPCTLNLLNSRFLGSEDECLNGLAIARANRTDGNNYIYNIRIAVPDIASSTPSINVTCSSDEIRDPLGTATIDIISNGENQLCSCIQQLPIDTYLSPLLDPAITRVDLHGVASDMDGHLYL